MTPNTLDLLRDATAQCKERAARHEHGVTDPLFETLAEVFTAMADEVDPPVPKAQLPLDYVDPDKVADTRERARDMQAEVNRDMARAMALDNMLFGGDR